MAVTEKSISGSLVNAASVSAELSASSAVSGALKMAQARVEKDYEKLLNKPCINGVELSGNKDFEELGFSELTALDVFTILEKIWEG